MSFFHTHAFVEIARTYAKPNIQRAKSLSQETFERMGHGSTTFVMRCSDPDCAEMKSLTVPGSIIEKM